MKNVSGVLEDTQHNLPQRASPVATSLRAQVDRAMYKVGKYEGRGSFAAVWKARSERAGSFVLVPWYNANLCA